MNNDNNNVQPNSNRGIEERLEALVALVAGVLQVVVKNSKSKGVSEVEDKVITALFFAGVPQFKIEKLLGVGTHRVSDICKKLKKK